jgi:plastocyanin
VNLNDTFEVTLDIEGAYDYLCILHEMAGKIDWIPDFSFSA